VALPSFDLFPAKVVIIASLYIQCASQILFCFTEKFWVQCFMRFINGACQVFLAIYLPVWVDAFAPRHKKTRWMTYNIMAAPLGLLVGYALTAIIVSLGMDWRWAFLRNSFIIVPVSVLYWFIKPQYLNIGKRLEKQEDYNEEHPPTEQQQQSRDRKISRYEKLNKKRMEAETIKTAEYDFWGRIRYCVTEVDFVLAMMSITSLFVVITGIQFWCTDYFVSVLGLKQA
jgi:MFS family permease